MLRTFPVAPHHSRPAPTARDASAALQRAQQELKESQRALTSLMSNLPGMAYRCVNTPDWPLTFVSEGAEALTGYTPRQLLENIPPYAALIHPDDQEDVWSEVQCSVRERRRFEFTYRLCTPTGEKWVREYGCGVFDDAGELRWIEGFIMDITESHRARDEVERLNRTLEEKVRRRTTELQAANEELEAFAYSIAHDLRAPMTSLAGFSRILERNLAHSDPVNTHYLRRIAANVTGMSELTDALLSLARLSSVRLDRQPVDVAELARAAAEQLVELAPERKVTILIADHLPAQADPALLRTVVTNLLANAWKFTSGLTADAYIEVSSDETASGERCFYVRDNGVGFDMSHASRLFGAFQRLHAQHEFDGTGIGLALVRKIVLRHGGRVWAEASPGEGATFFFTLP